MHKTTVFWFRRDLRLTDNTGLHQALASQHKVLPVFIFDTNILSELPQNDARVSFIYETLQKMNSFLTKYGSGIKIYIGSPKSVWNTIIKEYSIDCVYANRDYEPYGRQRDKEISELLSRNAVELKLSKDQVVFEENEVVKKDGLPYTVYTPYKKQWLTQFTNNDINAYKVNSWRAYYSFENNFPTIEEIGFVKSEQKVKDFQLENLDNYSENRNLPAIEGTSNLSVHLRFGTVSVREIMRRIKGNESFLSELIWREFFMQILYHFPRVINHNFREKYNYIQWRNDEKEFEKWCQGKTGYPLVDAGMRELNQTGYMHNRVRMVVASFLVKHLLIDWRWGEAYFAEKLLDFELSSNNGNWQWVAGTGCDAAPYFRIFNPIEQLKKFDSQLEYVRQWVNELDSDKYPQPIVEHKQARQRALNAYKNGLQ